MLKQSWQQHTERGRNDIYVIAWRSWTAKRVSHYPHSLLYWAEPTTEAVRVSLKVQFSTPTTNFAPHNQLIRYIAEYCREKVFQVKVNAKSCTAYTFMHDCLKRILEKSHEKLHSTIHSKIFCYLRFHYVSLKMEAKLDEWLPVVCIYLRLITFINSSH